MALLNPHLGHRPQTAQRCKKAGGRQRWKGLCSVTVSTNGGNIRWEARPPDCYSSAPGSDAPTLAPDRPRHPQPCLIVSQGDHGPVPSPSNKLLFPSGPPGSVLSLSCWWEKRTVLPTSQCPLSCPAASASTWTTWSLHSLISSQSQSPVPQTGEASRAPPAKWVQGGTQATHAWCQGLPLALSSPLLVPLPPDCRTLPFSLALQPLLTALVPVFSGLLVIKSLGLSALLLWWVMWIELGTNRAGNCFCLRMEDPWGNHQETSGKIVTDRAVQVEPSLSLSTWPPLTGHLSHITCTATKSLPLWKCPSPGTA
jgi:hypothetical protein